MSASPCRSFRLPSDGATICVCGCSRAEHEGRTPSASLRLPTPAEFAEQLNPPSNATVAKWERVEPREDGGVALPRGLVSRHAIANGVDGAQSALLALDALRAELRGAS